MRSIMRNRLQAMVIFICLFGLILSFQNCAKTEFKAQKSSSSEADGDNDGLGNPVDGDGDGDERWSDDLGRRLDDPFSNSDDNDQNAKDYATQTGGPNCSEQLQELRDPVHMIFVVDTSGSNLTGNGGGFFSWGTDPDKVVRAESMQRFFNSYKDRANFSWSLIHFAEESAHHIADNTNSSGMQSALLEFRNMSDDGYTPYLEALDKTADSIDPNRINIVVFLSDGVPQPEVRDGPLRSSVTDVVLSGNRVAFNTVYYGPRDRDASDRLDMMAEVGEGNFLDTNANATGNLFLISDLVVVPGVQCN